MLLTSTLSSFLSGITSLESQNKVTKIPNYLTLLFTIILVLPKLTMNSIIYSTESQGSSIIGSTVLLSTPSNCDLGGESSTFSTKTFGIYVAFIFVPELG
jgi:hypothetical protein